MGQSLADMLARCLGGLQQAPEALYVYATYKKISGDQLNELPVIFTPSGSSQKFDQNGYHKVERAFATILTTQVGETSLDDIVIIDGKGYAVTGKKTAAPGFVVLELEADERAEWTKQGYRE